MQEGPAIWCAVAAGLKEAGGSVGTHQSGQTGRSPLRRSFAFEASLPPRREGGNAQLVSKQSATSYGFDDSVREFNNSTGASRNFAEGINNVAEAVARVDVAGFIQKIRETGGVLDRFFDSLANAGLIERFAEAVTGLELTVGKPIDLRTV